MMKRRTSSDCWVSVGIVRQWGRRMTGASAPLETGRRRSAARAELLFQEGIELSRIGLALSGLHRLADEEAEQLVLAGAVVGKLAWIAGDHFVDDALDRRAVRDLLEAFLLDDGIR